MELLFIGNICRLGCVRGVHDRLQAELSEKQLTTQVIEILVHWRRDARRGESSQYSPVYIFPTRWQGETGLCLHMESDEAADAGIVSKLQHKDTRGAL